MTLPLPLRLPLAALPVRPPRPARWGRLKARLARLDPLNCAIWAVVWLFVAIWVYALGYAIATIAGLLWVAGSPFS